MFNNIYDKIKKIFIDNKGFIIFIVVLICFLHIKLPYIIYTPGGHIDLQDRIEIVDSYEVEGSFNMAYVRMVYGTPATVLLSYIMPNWDLEKTSNITLEGQSIEELENYQKLSMDSSLDIATLVAYEKAGKEVLDIVNQINIAYIQTPAKTDIKINDIIYKIDSIIYPTLDDLTLFLEDKKEGDTVNITVLRDGLEVQTTSTLYKEGNRVLIGIVFVETYEFNETPKLTFDEKNGESGPSGGMILTLSIYNSLTKDDLTKNRKIVGTGTISLDGVVGKIDGVKYKILGSLDADIFLCPVDNYEEAIKVKEEFDLDLTIVKVETIDDAIEYLKNN